MRLSAAILALAVAAASVSAGGLPSFKLFKQCDPRWGSDRMGVKGPGERATICQEGCAMTSLTMALEGLGATVRGQDMRPNTLNAWLEATEGYTCIAGDCNNLVLNATDALPGSPLTFVSEHAKPGLGEFRSAVEAGRDIFIAHVHDNGHFVLVTGVDASAEDAFLVNDPFYAATSYPYANISDVLHYRISRAFTTAPLVGAAGPEEVLGAGTVVPFKMPLYKQCDKRWGSDKIDTDTVCQVGCLMSSTSMAIGGHRIAIEGKTSDPGTLNAWLRAHHGYEGNDLIESAVPGVDPSKISWPADGMHTKNDVSLAQVQKMLRAGRPVIANVMKGAHFVLVTGWNATHPDSLVVNDPGFDREFYSHSRDVVGWRLFGMQFA